jgi:hypothetical protein
MSESGQIDLDGSLASVRESVASLGTMIESLRDEADGLLERAAGRTVLAVLDRPADAPAAAEADIAAMEGSIAAMGRHAADVPEEFDPRPFDPDDDELADGAPAEPDVDVLEDLAAGPAFEPMGEVDAQLPALDVPSVATPLQANEPQANLAPEEPTAPAEPGDDGDGGHVAEVIAFTPRTPAPDPVDAPAAPAPPIDDEPAFGFLSTELDAPEEAPAPPEQAVEAARAVPPAEPGVAPEAAASDGLDAIAESGSTDVPANWDGPNADDDAFDKFFSADVEPEPAQRWLLNE